MLDLARPCWRRVATDRAGWRRVAAGWRRRVRFAHRGHVVRNVGVDRRWSWQNVRPLRDAAADRRAHGGHSSIGRAPGCDPGGWGFKSPWPPQDARLGRESAEQSGDTLPSRLASLAQLAEQWTLNPLVLGSSPRGSTTQGLLVRAGPASFFVRLGPLRRVRARSVSRLPTAFDACEYCSPRRTGQP